MRRVLEKDGSGFIATHPPLSFQAMRKPGSQWKFISLETWKGFPPGWLKKRIKYWRDGFSEEEEVKADRGKGAISGGYIALVSKGFLVAIGVDASLLMMMMVAVRVLKWFTLSVLCCLFLFSVFSSWFSVFSFCFTFPTFRFLCYVFRPSENLILLNFYTLRGVSKK